MLYPDLFEFQQIITGYKVVHDELVNNYHFKCLLSLQKLITGQQSSTSYITRIEAASWHKAARSLQASALVRAISQSWLRSSETGALFSTDSCWMGKIIASFVRQQQVIQEEHFNIQSVHIFLWIAIFIIFELCSHRSAVASEPRRSCGGTEYTRYDLHSASHTLYCAICT